MKAPLAVVLVTSLIAVEAFFSLCPSCHIFGGDMAGCNLTDADAATLPDCLPDDLVALFVRAYRPATLPDGFFANHIQITTLAIQDVPSLRLGPMVFLHLPALVKLELEDAHVAHIPAGQFHPLPELEILYLNNTSLQVLPRGLLAMNRKLRYFQATNGDLTGLPEDLFSRNPLLRQVHLSRNRLFSLPAGLFRHNPRLQEVHLNKNRLLALPPGLFAANTEMQTVKLGANPWRCSCRLSRTVTDLAQRMNLTGPVPKCRKPRDLNGIPVTKAGDRLKC